VTQRVFVVSTAPLPTKKAYGIAIDGLCRSLTEIGFELEIIAPPPLGPHSEDAELIYLDSTLALNMRRLQNTMLGPVFSLASRHIYARKAARLVRSRRPDYLWTRDVIVANLCMTYVTNLVLEEHQYPTRRQSRRYKHLAKKITKHNTRCRVVAISNHIYSALQSLGIPGNQLLLEPSGVTKVFFDIPLWIPRDSIKIGYLGRFTTLGIDKGVTGLVESFLEVQKRYPTSKLVLVGATEPELETISKLARDLGLPLHSFDVLLQIPHSQVAEVMSSLDVLLFPYPSRREFDSSSPLKLLEYAASGRPICSTNSEALGNVLSGKVVYTYDAHDPLSMVEALTQILDDPEAAQNRVKVAREMARPQIWVERSKRILSSLTS